MIEIAQEELLPLSEVPRRLPPRASGRRIHVSAVYRWAQRGVRGVRLEVIRVGGTTYTSLEALQRFAMATTRSSDEQAGASLQPGRRRQIEQAAERVKKLWSGI